MIRILGFGSGVQTVCAARMSLAGELPLVDHMIFADTGGEVPETYAAAEEIESACHERGVGFHRVTCHYKQSSGSLLNDLLGKGSSARWAAPPLHTINPDGSKGLTPRQCTSEFKTEPIWRKVREISGVGVGGRGPKEVIVEYWIGITCDEKERMKLGPWRWVRIWHPFIEGARPMHRSECAAWLRRNGYRVPPKSACFFCPYQSDRRWIELKMRHPELFAKAVVLDKHMRDQGQFGGEVFLHASRLPLDQAVAAAERELERSPTFDMEGFGDECHGVCGV
jgi:hypothetical protein